MRAQRLRDVCNGAHFHNLNRPYYMSERQFLEGLKKKLKLNQNHGIMIVAKWQYPAETALKKKKLLREIGITVKKLCQWSNSANLWRVKLV